MAAMALANPRVHNAVAALPDRVYRCMGDRPGRISEWRDRRFVEGRARASVAFDEPGDPAVDLSQPERRYSAQPSGRAWRGDWLERVSLTSPCGTLRVYGGGFHQRSHLGNLAFAYTLLRGLQLCGACLVFAAVFCDRVAGD